MASGGFLLLVGPAACGKSRCAYELARSMLVDWPMFMPSTAGQVTDYFGTNPAPGRLVVWLNETQKFLGSSGLTVETVRHILALPWPVIMVGTIWPQTYDALTGTPGTGLGDSTQDAREILSMIAQRKDLLPGFSAAELERAGALAARDPRIAEALTESVSSNLTETLAAAPDLISRWLNAADPYGGAVITAAVIARRCGHPEPLPAKVLQPLAEKVLTPAERSRAANHWFAAALNWARVPVRGDAAPLMPYGSVAGIVDGDQVSDVLVQHAIRDQEAPGHALSDALWVLLIEHATPSACRSIADVAYQVRHAHQFTIAESAIRKAAEAGDGVAMANLGILLREQGKDGEAEQWFREAVEAGNADAMLLLGSFFTEHGNIPEAERWLRKAVAIENVEAMIFLGAVLTERGDSAEAEQWLRKAADAHNTDAMVFLGNHLKKKGEAAGAEQLFRVAAEAGNADAMLNLGVLLAEQNKEAEVEQLYRGAATGGNLRAMANLAMLLHQQGKSAEGELWLRRAAEGGNARAMVNLGIYLRDCGETVDAEQWISKAIHSGDTHAAALLGAMFVEQGEISKAAQWLRIAAEAGNPNAMALLGILLRDCGETVEAEQWIRKAVQAGDADVETILGTLRN
jgi:TPR repeat protein